MAPVDLPSLVRRGANSLGYAGWRFMNLTSPPPSTAVPTGALGASSSSLVTLSDFNGTASVSSITRPPPYPSTLVTELPRPSTPQARSTITGFTTETTTLSLSLSGPPNTTTLFVTMAGTDTDTTTIFTAVTAPPIHLSLQTLPLSRALDTDTGRRSTTVTITRFPTPTIYTTITLTWFPPPSTTTITELTTQIPSTATATPAPDNPHGVHGSGGNDNDPAPSFAHTRASLTTSFQSTSLSIPSTSLSFSFYITAGLPAASLPDSPTTRYIPSFSSCTTHTSQPSYSAVAGTGKGSAEQEKSVTTIVGTVCGAVTFVLALFAVGAWWMHKKGAKKAKKAKNERSGSTAASGKRASTKATWMSGGLGVGEREV